MVDEHKKKTVTTVKREIRSAHSEKTRGESASTTAPDNVTTLHTLPGNNGITVLGKSDVLHKYSSRPLIEGEGVRDLSKRK